jgi:TolB-like protein
MTNHPAMRKACGLILMALLALAASAAVWAEPAPVKIAFLKIENQSNDPRYDYLEGIISGTLLYDLANDPGFIVVDRTSLDLILKEQELIMSDLVKSENAVRVGKILGADYLLKGNYVFMNTEIRVGVSIIQVETAKTMSFNETGSTENVMHALAERIVDRLTGRKVTLRSEEHDRSIISLKDEKPGTIGLFCNLIDAEIFVDEQFFAITTGKGNVPTEITGLKPGKHTVRVHLGNFGVVKTPEITFSDWQQTVDVKPGLREVVRAQISLFSYQLYDFMKLVMETVRIKEGDFGKPFSKDVKLEFVDREGKKNTVILKLKLTISAAQAELKADLVYNGKATPLSVVCPAQKAEEIKKAIEKVDVQLELKFNPDYKYCDVGYRVFRNDISDDMWMNK